MFRWNRTRSSLVERGGEGRGGAHMGAGRRGEIVMFRGGGQAL